MLEVGSAVIASGLQSEAGQKFNGQRGLVVSGPGKTGRQDIHFTSIDADRDVFKSISMTNLAALQRPLLLGKIRGLPLCEQGDRAFSLFESGAYDNATRQENFAFIMVVEKMTQQRQ